MLETTRATQGAGITLGASARPLRVLPIVPSGDEAELDTIWQACAVLQSQGYPVVVLDGSDHEAPGNPGLEDLLSPHSGFAHTALPVTPGLRPEHIASLPAARGMVELVDKAGQQGVLPLEMLYRHVRNHAVVVLIASAPLMAMLLQGSSRAAVQLVPTQQRYMAESYRALRHLFQHSGLMPHLVALRTQGAGIDPMLKALAQCAHENLGEEPLAEQLDPSQARQLRRWALQCLEQSEAIYPPESHSALSGGEPISPVAALVAATGAAAQRRAPAPAARWSH